MNFYPQKPESARQSDDFEHPNANLVFLITQKQIFGAKLPKDTILECYWHFNFKKTSKMFKMVPLSPFWVFHFRTPAINPPSWGQNATIETPPLADLKCHYIYCFDVRNGPDGVLFITVAEPHNIRPIYD